MSGIGVEQVSWRAGGVTILEDVTFEVGRGEFVVIGGRNGAGKSTLLDIIAGLKQPTGGEVRLQGRPLSEWKARARAKLLAHLPQALRPDLPFLAEEVVLMGRYPHADRWFESEEDRRIVEWAMRRTACWERRHRLIGTLSGGERQLVLLAACLAQQPEVFLFDEPSTHLDLDQQLHCFSLLEEERARGASCLAVTHDLNLALTYGTRLIVLAQGRVALDLSMAEAIRSPQWLALFSDRLTLETTLQGRPWVTYA
jgi:iron complex transport system ATP-binding protein